jgi:hypothetical protein
MNSEKAMQVCRVAGGGGGNDGETTYEEHINCGCGSNSQKNRKGGSKGRHLNAE